MVQFNDTLDANTTFVNGSLHASPLAFNDTYAWVGNTTLDSAARSLPSLFANDVAPLSETAGQHYGQIRAALETRGQTIGNNDLWIAAHARAEGWILVTNNEREFKRVKGLQVENWVRA